MTAAAWCAVAGFLLGFDVALAYTWLISRRVNRSITLRFDTPAARKALRDTRKPW